MRRQHVLAAAIFVVLTLAMTWPLAPNLGRAVADPGDPLINIWILDWDWWATLHQPLSLFHANVFHPAQYSLAYSENLYGVAVLLFPLRAAGVGPVAAYNIALIAGIAFCGFGAYVLGFHLTRSFAAGLAAGVFYAFVPFRFVHLAHVQHAWGGWLPLLLYALLLYAERPSWKRGALFAALFVMNGLTNIHYLLFGALATAVTAALLVPRSAWRELVVPFVVPLLLGLLVLAPFLYPYVAVQKLYGMQRSYEEVLRYSAMPGDWLTVGGWRLAEEPERRVYPGALALIVSALAVWFARREKAKIALAVLWIVIGFAGSLGLHFVFHGFLFGGVPGFRAIRAPARWAVIAYIGMAILIALFTAAIGHRRLRWIVPAAFVIALWAAPVRWFLIDPKTPEVYRWLAKQEVSAVIELPVATLSSEYEYMLHATAHHQRIVNGVSGFEPPQRGELTRLSKELSDGFVDALRAHGVDTVIVHSDRYGADAPAMRDWLRRELDRGRLRYVAHFDARTGADWVFSLKGGKGARPRDVDVFLYGAATCTESIAGALDFPPGGHPYKGAAQFRGWASSPYGIASVDLWFNNRRVRYPARMKPLRSERCPGLPPVSYELTFAKRPKDIRRETDVQVEVKDRRGGVVVFEDRWISWDDVD
ncbi:MAG TPA: hypothetical protein VF432_14400 [Thermoanaerobaculia bacterium]